ncbi:uncharacterized protein PHALS_07767 [Plasmopara halstedii]|uniref:RxLR-like protein n=1 Tax=Plasmopara halstedii TaxID=4781 RepID=A0A0P1B669_PLAHL|nr:uncharacterized protein PHALS_07767 [Plasmopara halstedii]CEG50037.1 hypothetical protein PHALS_07767 [Plasmopara halstedii]|eukprot:XP_024586406.1 hypothetical protein PHALS_07767 [Plasmopara halstedii]
MRHIASFIHVKLFAVVSKALDFGCSAGQICLFCNVGKYAKSIAATTTVELGNQIRMSS